MASWSELESDQPDFAQRLRARLDAFTHKTIATLRKDGSPRISGTEVIFHGDDLWIGSMSRSRKALDLLRDPRFALHSGSEDPPGWDGDGKVSGAAQEVTDPELFSEVMPEGTEPGAAHLFRLDLLDATLIGLDEERKHLVIELWRPGRPLERMIRD